jgi:hypothetical protein
MYWRSADVSANGPSMGSPPQADTSAVIGINLSDLTLSS